MSCFDGGGPLSDEGSADASVVECRFITGERAAVIAHEYDEGVVGDFLFLEFSNYFSDVLVEAADLIVVEAVVFSDFGGVRHVRRDCDVTCLMGRIEGSVLVSTVWIKGSEPEEEGFILGPALKSRDPGLATTGGSGDHLSGFSIGSSGEDEAGGGGFEDIIEAIFYGFAEMPLTGSGGIVAGGFELLNEGEGFGWEWPVELFGSGVVRVASGDHAGAAWAAGICGEVSVLEGDSGLGKGVDVRSFDRRVAVGAAVIPVHVISDDEDDVGLFCKDGENDRE